MLLALLLACPGPTPPPVPPEPASEWVDITKPPGSADGVRCWAWKGVDPVCQWANAPLPPPPVPPVPPPAEEAPKAEVK